MRRMCPTSAMATLRGATEEGGTMASAEITAGKHSTSLAKAREVIQRYTGAVAKRRTKSDFYAWPYYDRMDNGSTAFELNDGDLLAPVLLNVDPGIHGFASLQRVRGRLVELLQEVPEGVSLADEAATKTVIDQVAALFSVLDDDTVFGVGGTTLSKVLHRKRPALIPLHDRFVRHSYVPGRIMRENGRSWADYMRLLMNEMQADLRATPAAWSALTMIPAGGGLTELRALDIISWYYGKAGL